MPPPAGKYDFAVDPGNRNTTYGLICDRVPRGAAVLDIGCASGNLALALERHRGCRVLGIDIDPDAVAVARSQGIDAVVADLTVQPVLEVVAGRRFDVIIMADVLEHLVDPAGVLAPVAALLTPEGRVLCSFPNITHIDIQLMLAQDQWRTRPAGILDQTHLRFFTAASFSEMAFACGYDVTAIERVILPALGTEVLDYGKGLRLGTAEVADLEAVARQGNANREVYQYVVELHPAPERRPLLDRVHPRAAAAEPQIPGLLDVVVRTTEGRLRYLKDALYSLVGVTYPAVRAIVCVDNSSSAYAEAVRELAVHFQGLLDLVVTEVPPHHEQRGRPLNWGLDQAHGEYISFLDDDDVYYPSFGDRLVGRLREHPEVTVAYGIGQVVRGDPTEWGFRTVSHDRRYAEPFDRAGLFLENYIPFNTLVVRRAAVVEAGIRFDESLPVYEDWAFLRELAARFEFEFVDAPISEYRLRTDGSNAASSGSAVEPWTTTLAEIRHRYGAHTVRLSEGALAALAETYRDAEARHLAEAATSEARHRAEGDALTAEIGALTAEIDALKAEIDALRGELVGTKTLIRVLLSSRSWRLTRPLRRLLRSGLPDKGPD
jgi:methionine biosynthesis protein MetW